MDLIAELIEMISYVKKSCEYCEIFEDSQIYWAGNTVKNNHFFTATLNIYRIQDVRIKIDGGNMFLNGFLSNEKAIKNHLKDLQDSLNKLEEAM